MDIESFEPSDESMEKIEARLKALRELREQRIAAAKRVRFRLHAGPTVPSELPWKTVSVEQFPEPLHFEPIEDVMPIEGDTAYTRTLRHEHLLKELEALGFRKWEELGKKTEFDRLTKQAIELGRSSMFLRTYSPEDPQNPDDESSSKGRLSGSWHEALENLNRRARGIRMQTAAPQMRLMYDPQPTAHHMLTSEVYINPSFQAANPPVYWVELGGHKPLEYVINAHGVHAEVAQTETGPKIKYEACEKDVRLDHHS